MLAWKTEADSMNPSYKYEVFPSVVPETIIKKMERRVFWANALRSFGAGIQQRTTTSTSLIANALKANTVFPNDYVVGTVYYPRKSKFDVISFNFSINGKIYALKYYVGKD